MPQASDPRHRALPIRQVSRPGRGLVSPEYCQIWHDRPVRVVGRPIFAEIERAREISKIDHLWVTLEVPEIGEVQLAINTLSTRNRNAGFDSRVRVGVSKSTCRKPPPPGLFPARLLDYAAVESNVNVFYETYEREALEDFLLERIERAALIQAWGIAFCRRYMGVHQIHSRRASCAISENLTGMDGALRFFYEDEHVAELVMFKFCGQP